MRTIGVFVLMRTLQVLLVATGVAFAQTTAPLPPAVPKSPLPASAAAQAQVAAAQAQAAAAQAQAAAEQARLQAGLSRVDNLWRSRGLVSQLNLTPAQVKQMETIFQQYRLKLIDLNSTLEKEELTLEPLVAAEILDEGKLTAQIDRVAQARAELEKSRGRMLVGIRKILQPEQWRKLNDAR
jgi:Spy/CpxP family protein refolding chaperone